MSKEFHVSFEGKNAKVVLLPSKTKAMPIKELTKDGLTLDSIRICKGLRLPSPDKDAVKAIIAGDPEIDLDWAGKILDISTRAYYKPGTATLEGSFEIIDVVTGPDGKEKERKPHVPKTSNSNHPTFPVAAGKLVPAEKFFQSFVVTRSYALVHDDGVKYDFLFQIAKKLDAAKSVALMGAGPKGNAPVIFQDGGKGYRCALHGKVEGDKYTLLVLVLGQELKIPESRNAPVTATT